ncbi:protein NEOXANTHIN-DEFICIENT 1 [Euphorbia lathyris]|uniref:protein NEOXANTHIN-DEFICIENT 1 n=1 Tax=Euphorbia lathyris TaxID=212925 RepID=UPI0033142BBE
MEVAERKCSSSSGYGKPPWRFKGSALYQLHLVKSETAKAFIPKEFKLVEAFGYTLGGFFLANYEDSPAGAFDELVVIAGIVWNPPTSCAWAARVLVSSDEACDHGRKEVGLPSYVAKFSKRISAVPKKQKSKCNQFLEHIGLDMPYSTAHEDMGVQVTKISDSGSCSTNICNINLATFPGWLGPEIKMSLPSFSGRTKYNSNLLKYTCNIECRMQAVPAAKVTGPLPETEHETEESMCQHKYTTMDSAASAIEDNEQNLIKSVMLSKPVLALKFNCLRMEVNAPTTVFFSCKNPTTSLGFP